MFGRAVSTSRTAAVSGTSGGEDHSGLAGMPEERFGFSAFQCMAPDSGAVMLSGGAVSSGSGAVFMGGGADPSRPVGVSDSGGTGAGAVPQVVMVSAGLC